MRMSNENFVDTETMKRCFRCNRNRKVEEFFIDRRANNRRGVCRDCINLARRQAKALTMDYDSEYNYADEFETDCERSKMLLQSALRLVMDHPKMLDYDGVTKRLSVNEYGLMHSDDVIALLSAVMDHNERAQDMGD